MCINSDCIVIICVLSGCEQITPDCDLKCKGLIGLINDQNKSCVRKYALIPLIISHNPSTDVDFKSEQGVYSVIRVKKCKDIYI